MAFRVMIADDHPVVRNGLQNLFAQEEDFEIVGEAEDGQQTVELAASLKPDVLFLDLMMPALNGLMAIPRILAQSPATRIIIFSMYGHESYVLEAMKKGAHGYLLKNSQRQHILEAVNEVMQGRTYLGPPIDRLQIEQYSQRARQESVDPFETLTSREREVLQLVAEGHTNAEIAQKLAISPRTADTHRTNLMRKLGLHSQTALIHYAIHRGLLPMAQSM